MKNHGISLRTSELMDITGTWPDLTQAIFDKVNALKWDAEKIPVDEVMDRFEPYFVKLDALIEKRLKNTFHPEEAKEIIQTAIKEVFEQNIPLDNPPNPGINNPVDEFESMPIRQFSHDLFRNTKEISLSNNYTENNRIGSFIIRPFTYAGYSLFISWNDTGEEQMISDSDLECAIQRSNEMLNLKNCAIVKAPEFSSDGKNLFIDGTNVLKGWKSSSGVFWFATYEEVSTIVSSKEGEEENIPDISYFGICRREKDEWDFWSPTETDEFVDGEATAINLEEYVSHTPLTHYVDPKERFISDFQIVKRDGKDIPEDNE